MLILGAVVLCSIQLLLFNVPGVFAELTFEPINPSVCPDNELTFVCTTAIGRMEWRIFSEQVIFQINSQSQADRVNETTYTLDGYLFTFVVENFDEANSMYTVSATVTVENTLNLTTVTCMEDFDGPSNSSTLTIPTNTPASPDNLQINSITEIEDGANITIEWDPSFNAMGYVIQAVGSDAMTLTRNVTDEETSVVLGPLVFNVEYTIGVSTVICAEVSAPSTMTTTIVGCVEPDPATNVQVISRSGGRIEGSGITFSCVPGLVPSPTINSTCSAAAIWSPLDPQDLVCMQDSSGVAVGSVVAIAVACSVVFFVLGVLITVLVWYLVSVCRRAPSSKEEVEEIIVDVSVDVKETEMIEEQ